MNEESDFSTIILDNGTGVSKIGLSGDEAPRKVFNTLVGYSRFLGLDIALDQNNFVIGNEAFEKRGLMNIVQPIKKGIIEDFNSMEKIWHQSFYKELKIDPQQHPIMITESPNNPLEKKEKTAEIFFENFNAPSFFILNQANLALISLGLTKGIVLDSGEGKTHVVPIYENYCLPHSTEELNICGEDVTNHLMKLMINSGLTFSKNYDIDIIKDIKEKKCKISLDYANEMKDFIEKANSKDILYELPDGETINIGSPQINSTEILFNPKLINKNIIGIPELIYKSYFSIDVEVRKELFNNIMITGGNTMFMNMAERISQEMKGLGGNSIDFKIIAPAERQYSSWIGGSILASLSTFSSMWISKADYEEMGSNCVNIKCL